MEAIDYIQSRLEQGDFRPGDQIVFFVEGEEAFPDTLVVEGGPSVLIPNVGTVSLAGILRSELQDHLSQELSKYLRNPIVRVRPTIRLTMDGSIRPTWLLHLSGRPPDRGGDHARQGVPRERPAWGPSRSSGTG